MSSVKNHKTQYSRAIRRSSPRAAQGGYAFMVFLVGLVVSSMTYIVHSISEAATTTAQHDARTREALLVARDALIHYAATKKSVSTKELERPGALPCPDRSVDNKGDDGGTACGYTRTRVGRLPWKSLGFDKPLVDSDGEPLWYAVSRCFLKRDADSHCGEYLINSNTPGQLEISGANAPNVIAIIFSPGRALTGQQRQKGTAGYVDAVNFLEGKNADGGDAMFEVPAERKDVFERRVRCESAADCPSDEFNDQLIVIRAEDFFPAVEAHIQAQIEQHIKPGLDEHYRAWGSYPYAVAFDGRETGRHAPRIVDHPASPGEPGAFTGFMPLNLHGMKDQMEGWHSSCSPSERDSKSNIKTRSRSASLQGGECRIRIDVCRKNDQDESSIEFQLVTRLGSDNHGWIDRGYFGSPSIESISPDALVQISRSVAVNGQGHERIHVAPSLSKQWARCNDDDDDDDDDDEDEGEDGSNWTRITVAVAPPRLIERLNSLDTETRFKWFFDNEWYRVIAYRVPNPLTGQLTIVGSANAEAGIEEIKAPAALIVGGPPLTEAKYQQRLGAPEVCAGHSNRNSSAYWSAYFESPNIPNCDAPHNVIDVRKPALSLGDSTLPANDRVIALRPSAL